LSVAHRQQFLEELKNRESLWLCLVFFDYDWEHHISYYPLRISVELMTNPDPYQTNPPPAGSHYFEETVQGLNERELHTAA
jgi:hypothetical protein